jgi:hypothetical protein
MEESRTLFCCPELLCTSERISENYLHLDTRLQKALVWDMGWTTGLRCWQMTGFLSSPCHLDRLWGPPSFQFNGFKLGLTTHDFLVLLL